MNNELFSLEGKIALVTGASSGLGVHFAKVLAGAGASVVAAARRLDKLKKLVDEITEADGIATAVALDVTDNDSVLAAFDKAEDAYGVIDVLINNAGVADPKYFLDIDESNWDFILETNLKGAWRVARECCDRLVKSRQTGSIVNIASLLGLATQSKQTAYAVSKAGLIHLTRSMALELSRYGIRVNAIAPGYFKTEINADFFASDRGKQYLKTIPSRRLGELDELDGPLLMFASDAGSFLTGAVLPVDGGHMVASR